MASIIKLSENPLFRGMPPFVYYICNQINVVAKKLQYFFLFDICQYMQFISFPFYRVKEFNDFLFYEDWVCLKERPSTLFYNHISSNCSILVSNPSASVHPIIAIYMWDVYYS